MENEQNQSNKFILAGLIGVMLGLFAGVIVIGNWLWPAQWYDASPVNLSPESQADYLRAVIDSYALNQDVERAVARYAELGAAAPTILENIQSNPGNLDPDQIQRFRSIVRADAVAAQERTAIESRGISPALAAFLILFLVLVAVLAIVYLLRQRSRTPLAEQPENETRLLTPTEDAPEEDILKFETMQVQEYDLPIAPTVAAWGMAEAFEAGKSAGDFHMEVEAIQPMEGEALPEDGPAKHSYDLEYNEGIGQTYSERPYAGGIVSPAALLKRGTMQWDQQGTVGSSGIRDKRTLMWIRTSYNRFRDGWQIFSRNRLAVFGVILLVIYALMAVAHPILMETIWTRGIYDPDTGFDPMVFPNPSPPTSGHLLGTDTLGRDVLSRLLAAATPTFVMAISAAITAAVIGTLIGAVSAYYRGIIDSSFNHIADMSLLAPAPLIMVVIGFTLEISPSKFGLIYGLLVGVGAMAIVMRSYALTIVNRPFIDASRVAGASASHIIFVHLVPHMLPLAAVNMLLTVTGVVFADGFIAFLGLSRARLNWGTMIYDSFTYQLVNGAITWNVLIPAALAISLFAAAFYFIATGLHQVVEPRLRER